MADNKVRFGLQNVHFAFKTDEGYETPIKVPGAVTLSTNAEGNQNIFYADNIPYVTFSSNSGYSGDLEMALIPDAVMKKLFGWEQDKNGALVEDAQGLAAPFALIYEIKGDARARRNVFYNCTATRPSANAATTTDSTDPQTETLNITMIPAQIGDKDITKASMELSDTNAEAYNGFFDAVYLPNFAAEQGE